MFVWNKIAVTRHVLLTMLFKMLFVYFQMFQEKKKCLPLLLKRKDVLGLLPTGFKSLIYQHFEIKC